MTSSHRVLGRTDLSPWAACTMTLHLLTYGHPVRLVFSPITSGDRLGDPRSPGPEVRSWVTLGHPGIGPLRGMHAYRLGDYRARRPYHPPPPHLR
jgi:hypothetical protein